MAQANRRAGRRVIVLTGFAEFDARKVLPPAPGILLKDQVDPPSDASVRYAADRERVASSISKPRVLPVAHEPRAISHRGRLSWRYPVSEPSSERVLDRRRITGQRIVFGLIPFRRCACACVPGAVFDAAGRIERESMYFTQTSAFAD